MDCKVTKESKLQEAIPGSKQGCNDQFFSREEEKIEELDEEISFFRQVEYFQRPHVALPDEAINSNGRK